MQSKSDPRSGPHPDRRGVIVLAGVATIVLAVAVELVPGTAPGFGLTQTAAVIVGAGLVLIGALGSRIIVAYRNAALLVLNTILLLVLVELAAGLLLGALPEPAQMATPADDAVREYYASRPWGRGYRQEFRALEANNKMYRPWVIWRSRPASGEHINIDGRGVRRTVGSDCSADYYRVLTFGGSTMWGMGAPDWGTIPSYLVRELEDRLGRPACIENLADHGYVSSQSVAHLLYQLRQGERPDLVIFYDGINDVYSAVMAGEVDAHYQLTQIQQRFEGTSAAKHGWLRERRAYRVVRRLLPPVAPVRTAVLPPHTADGITRTYLGNQAVVAAIADAYGFAHAFFWQPNLLVGSKPLSEVERRMRREVEPEVSDLMQDVYALVREAAARIPNLHDISAVFDDVAESLYIDWMHVVPEANAIIARAIAELTVGATRTVQGH